ncbi:transcription antitermination factor NusB [Priestia taiwanensis]|uniref:Transcription antitermination protein NusB n=1 Tax=Priestia taiwanensis TaxID=1347902 RepID=A0A917AIC1_9BACI|nr:transcription antitermination factor NusB [Priestia taiwanensis]MBM7361400.1 N utilization substance protein B [Priestia taiwanensis]GGE53856.1 N utilization substance protein B [Priestia taiwanensis]
MKRRTARERALQALYQIDLAQIEPKEAIMNVLEENNEKGSEFLESLVFGYIEHKEEIDTIIRQNLAKWKLERIGSIDRNILRVAVCEMKFIEDVPTTVSLNEAIEVAKVYGDEESKRFINAVLEKVKASMN